MFTYRLHLEAGSDAGEATYAMMIQPGEETRRQRPAVPRPRVAPFDEEDESPFVGLIQVEVA
jgi:hypothetical protein